jgi:hypothetical protein
MTIDLTESAVGGLIGDIAGHREYLNGPISEEGWKQLKEAIGETDNGREYEWNKVKGLKFDRSAHEKCEEECKTFVKEILEQLKIRFKSKEKVKALDIFDPRSVPVNKEQLDSYGISELRQLFDFYTKRKKITKRMALSQLASRPSVAVMGDRPILICWPLSGGYSGRSSSTFGLISLRRANSRMPRSAMRSRPFMRKFWNVKKVKADTRMIWCS